MTFEDSSLLLFPPARFVNPFSGSNASSKSDVMDGITRSGLVPSDSLGDGSTFQDRTHVADALGPDSMLTLCRYEFAPQKARRLAC